MKLLPLVLPGLLLALTVPAEAQRTVRAPFVTNRAREADGAAICGLGKEFHAGRRAALRERLGSGVVVLRGMPEPRANATFRQDKNFWYLTGIESPNVCLLIDVDSGEEILFVNKPSAWDESWMGEIWDTDDQWVKDITGIQDVRANDSGRGGNRGLLEALDELMAGDEPRTLWTIQAAHVELAGSYDAAGPYDRRREQDSLDGRVSREAALARHLGERYGVEVKDLTPELYEMRVIKTPTEIDAIRRACRAGGLAMAEAVRSTRPDLGEWELGALLSWVQQRHGADGPAYAAIVGSGVNSLVLHYNFSTRRMRDGEVVLIDFGPEVDHYVTDITRTWPVGGTFTPKMAEIYDAVLDAQLAGIEAARPGNTLQDVNRAAMAVIKERGYSCPHGACHGVGMEVHDPGKLSGRKLEPGMVFTIEPGIYDKATGIGVRIEDVVLITEDGCEVLSPECPKDREALEALWAERGILELVDGTD